MSESDYEVNPTRSRNTSQQSEVSNQESKQTNKSMSDEDDNELLKDKGARKERQK